ncbi:hypothetical protein MT349_12315 [Rathayibacter caricis]|nr:hypothetical protein [Rathayibacter caricis]
MCGAADDEQVDALQAECGVDVDDLDVESLGEATADRFGDAVGGSELGFVDDERAHGVPSDEWRRGPPSPLCALFSGRE